VCEEGHLLLDADMPAQARVGNEICEQRAHTNLDVGLVVARARFSVVLPERGFEALRMNPRAYLERTERLSIALAIAVLFAASNRSSRCAGPSSPEAAGYS
jgi:hypothetical protein